LTIDILTPYKKMRFFVILSFLTTAQMWAQGKFVLPSVPMDDKVFQECSYCDARADRAGSRATASALKEFMTKNHIQFIVDKGDVSVHQSYPDEKIDTGHSCSVTAEAQDVRARAEMVRGSVNLTTGGFLYIDQLRNSIAVANVDHKLTVNLRIRVWGGFKFFGKCKRYGRKTCETSGTSKGTNHIAVNLIASEVLTECVAGQEHLTFNLDVKVFNEAKQKTYASVSVGKRSGCNLNVLGIRITSINSKVQKYASRYTTAKPGRFDELRGSRLVAELERKLGVRLGSTVTVPITNPNGSPRVCGRTKRGATEGSPNCTRKNCPTGFTRIGESEMCQKSFGLSRPNCTKYDSKAKLVTHNLFPNIKFHWCHTPRQ